MNLDDYQVDQSTDTFLKESAERYPCGSKIQMIMLTRTPSICSCTTAFLNPGYTFTGITFVLL